MPEIIEYSDELTHYGRLGMKWGQHIFGRDVMGRKVIKRLTKYDKKVRKIAAKQAKAEVKAAKGASAKFRTDFSVEKYRKNMEKALKYEHLGLKEAKKAFNFAHTANEVFGVDPIKGLNQQQIEIGRTFALQFARPQEFVVSGYGSQDTGNTIQIVNGRAQVVKKG